MKTLYDSSVRVSFVRILCCAHISHLMLTLIICVRNIKETVSHSIVYTIKQKLSRFEQIHVM